MSNQPIYAEYPWLQPVWTRLLSILHSGRLPHALLIKGVEGLGKTELACRLADLLLCERADQGEFACGACQQCRLQRAATHPDFLLLTPEEKGKAITVDSVRQLSHFTALKSQLAKRQVVVISPAESMNKFAANSLLKTLEEPSDNCVIILVVHQVSRILPTLRSRCQALSIPSVEPALLQAWLLQQVQQQDITLTAAQQALLVEQAGGAPLTALAYLRNEQLDQYDYVWNEFRALAGGKADPVALASSCVNIDVKLVLTWLQRWVMDMVRLKLYTPQTDSIESDYQQKLRAAAQRVAARALFHYLDNLNETKRRVDGQVNRQLLLESLFINWVETCVERPSR